MSTLQTQLRACVDPILTAADPGAALAQAWRAPSGRCYLLASGKASDAMAAFAMRRLGQMAEGVCTAPPNSFASMLLGGSAVHVYFCDHPYPTLRNQAAAGTVLDLVSRVGPDDTLIALISGGASAHLTFPAEGLTVADIAAVTRALQLAGATIYELNTVRKHAEQLKGGRLAALCRGRVEAYILSDVMGDPLDVIASGPTAGDPTTYADALAVLDRRGCTGAAPALTAHLRRGAAGEIAETPKPGDPGLSRVTNTIIASNRLVVEAAAAHLRGAGVEVVEVAHGVEGEAHEIGERLARTLDTQDSTGTVEVPRTRAVVWGGEPVVSVGEGGGSGGPSQEVALAAAVALEGVPGWAMLALSTDGRDGPTDAAGAIVDGETAARARAAGVDPVAGIARHDSHRVLDGAGALLRLPPTGTNLNHIYVALF